MAEQARATIEITADPPARLLFARWLSRISTGGEPECHGAAMRSRSSPDRTWSAFAFDEGAEATMLAKQFKAIAFPETEADRREKLRGGIANTARKLSSLIAEEGSPVPKKLAVRVEEIVGELLEAIEN